MNVFLRVLRIIAFIGVLMVFLLVVAFSIPFKTILNRAIGLGDMTGYLCCILISLMCAYPILFLITVCVMKKQGFHVCLVYGHKELSLLELFMQNEYVPFREFLFDKFTTIKSYRFPYSVDFGYTNNYPFMRVVAKSYRIIRAILILCIIAAVFYFSASYIARTI